MGLFDFMKKKHDDFSFDNDSFGSANDSFSSSSDSFSKDSFGSSSDSFGKDSFSSPDPFAAPTDGSLPPLDMPGSADPFKMPDHVTNARHLGADTVDSSPDNISAFGQTPGQQMARDYISKEQGQSTTQQAPADAHTLEMINVKLDAIRSSLDAMNQRLQHLEQMSQRNNNNKGW